jgi:hypothetical protein
MRWLSISARLGVEAKPSDGYDPGELGERCGKDRGS